VGQWEYAKVVAFVVAWLLVKIKTGKTLALSVAPL
jgi:hypothetical protein